VVHLLAFVPAFDETQARNLRLVVGVLAAGDFVVIDLCGAGFESRLEWCVVVPHGLPVVGQFLQPGGVNLGVALASLKGGNQGVQVGLGGEAGEGGEGGIHDIHSSFAGFEQHG